MQKRGMSEIITTLIIIVLTLVAVGIVWIVVMNIISESSEDVSLNLVTAKVDIKEVKILDSRNISIKIKREPGREKIEGLEIVVSNGINSEIFRINGSINELEEKKFILNTVMNTSTIKEISIASISKTESGKEKINQISDTFKISSSGSSSSSSGGGCIIDIDLDGFISNFSCGGNDCNDNNNSIKPGATEICWNGIDENCNTLIDEGCCTPQTCSSLGYNCGSWTNGTCSGTLNCGSCNPSNESCVSGICARNDTLFLKNMNGLVSWWRMNGNANDEMGRNNGTISLANCSVAGKYRFGCDFNTSNFINVTDSNSLDITGSITISAWIKPRSIPLGFSAFINKYVINTNGYGLGFENSYNCDSNPHMNMFYGTISNWNNPCPSVTPTLNTWQFLTGIYDTGTSTFSYYKDNDTPKTIVMSRSNSANSVNLFIGKQINGTIDEVMIFNRSLTANEVSTLYGLNLN